MKYIDSSSYRLPSDPRIYSHDCSISRGTQHGCSPNDVRKLSVQAPIDSQRIKIAPIHECMLEMQLNENEAIARANENEMYRRIFTDKHSTYEVAHKSYPRIDHIVGCPSNQWESYVCGSNLNERFDEEATHDYLMKMLQHCSIPPMCPNVSHERLHYSNVDPGDHYEVSSDDMDEGIFELDM
jgi:hypothetical protein